MARPFHELLKMPLQTTFIKRSSRRPQRRFLATSAPRTAQRAWSGILFLILGLAACTPQADAEPPRVPALAGSLQPYQTPTPSVTPLPATPIPTQTPLPTATPHIYVIASGDTMGSIALELSVDMNDLVNANPDVSPYSMSVGQELIIPHDGEGADKLPPQVSLDITLSDPDCYATLSGGMWCFVLVQNNEENAIESLSIEVRLFDNEGALIESNTAFSLLNHLSVGKTQALPVYFENISDMSFAQSEVLTAFEITDEAERYPPAVLQGVLTQISWDGKSAEVSGEVLVDGDISQVWVLATALDANDNVVGIRRWEGVAGGQIFNLTVASVGPAIERVILSTETQR
jgi:LysM repeat protein